VILLPLTPLDSRLMRSKQKRLLIDAGKKRANV